MTYWPAAALQCACWSALTYLNLDDADIARQYDLCENPHRAPRVLSDSKKLSKAGRKRPRRAAFGTAFLSRRIGSRLFNTLKHAPRSAKNVSGFVPSFMKLSIVIPFYNEAATIETLLHKVLAVRLDGVDKEILAVNDGSTDGSAAIVERFVRSHANEVRLISFAANAGKGRSVIAGLRQAVGDILIVQDADLEYEPDDYRTILEIYQDPTVKVVFGSRILGAQRHLQNGLKQCHSYERYYWGGRLVTLVANLLYATHLTDEPTCYKSLRREVLDELDLQSTGFEFCPEITAKILRRGHRIVEVPIHYYPRSFEQGKKIRYTDGLKAIWTLVRLRWP